MQGVIGVAAQGGQGFFQEGLPHVHIVGLKLRRGVVLHKGHGGVRLQAGLADFAHQGAGGFLGEQRFGRAACGHAQQQRKQRAIVFMAAGGFGPGGGHAALVVVHLGQGVVRSGNVQAFAPKSFLLVINSMGAHWRVSSLVSSSI